MIWHETRRHDAAHRWLRELVVAEMARPETSGWCTGPSGVSGLPGAP